MTSRRNPPWTRDELILALELYFRLSPLHISETHPEVVSLSKLLNQLAIHIDRPDPDRFRNPNGVYMKMCNFLRLDPSYKGVGLDAGSKGDVVVWKEFSERKELLKEVCKAIREGVKSHVQKEPLLSEDEEELSAPEGRFLFRLHRDRERNQSISKKRKQEAIKKDGKLSCEVCEFCFSAHYGPLGDGFIECHHTIPVHKLSPGERTKLSDLSLVCSNCHRMLHRGGDLLSVKILREIREKQIL